MSPILEVEITYDFGSRVETGTERPLLLYIIYEQFNDWRGRGYDDFVPGEVTKTAPSGDRTT